MLKICEIGTRFSTTHSIEYLSNLSFIDFDMIILDIDYVSKNSHSFSSTLFDKRRKSLEEYLTFRKIPIVVFAPTIERINIGGYLKDFEEVFPLPNFKITTETGKSIQVIQNKLFVEFLGKYKNYFTYQSYFNDFTGIPLLQTPTKKVLSFYDRQSILMPKLGVSLNSTEELIFLNDLYETIKLVNKNSVTTELPEWTKNYFLPKEKPINQSILDIKYSIIKLKEKLDLEEDKIENFKNKKTLLFGTGDALEYEIESIFSELGFEILESDRDRDDLIVKFQDKTAVVEIKGTSGTSGEKHSAQLEKWVFFAAAGKLPLQVSKQGKCA